MIATHIHDALAQVDKLQELILEKRLFRGYSGKARLACAGVVIAGTAVLGSRLTPATPTAHLVGWGVVLGAGIVLNYAYLLYWFLFDHDARRNPVMLKPALDALPALAVGAVLTVVLIRLELYDLLFGCWMCLYGLAQAAYRHSLPAGIYWVGIAYILCGMACLLSPRISFTQPWPMGAVFTLGELAGGVVVLQKRKAYTRE
jgi:hypothetical protein